MRHLGLGRHIRLLHQHRPLSNLASGSDAPRKPAADSQTPTETTVNPRWLTDIKTRIGKCIAFGMSPAQVDDAGKILKELANDWKNLTVGCEGFLTQRERAGLHSHPIIWGDQDSMGHVNNVQYVRYAETGRTNWTRNYGKHFDNENKKQWDQLLTSRNVGLILKSITVDYKFPMTWPDKISVYHKLRSRPNESTSSMLLDVMILSEFKQRPAARCLEDVVVYDYRSAKKSSLPSFMLDQFAQTFDLQEKAKRDSQAKVSMIEDDVRSLETSSWDRPDAKENFGNATP